MQGEKNIRKISLVP